jgi:hypothetical protein
MVAVPPFQHLFAPYTLRALTVRNCMMDAILQPGAPEGCL